MRALRARACILFGADYRLCELFFKWIEHHLRIKAFYGTSEGAVKTQMVFPIDQTLNRRMPLWQPMQARLSWRSLTNCPS
jgi:hypothetical protein